MALDDDENDSGPGNGPDSASEPDRAAPKGARGAPATPDTEDGALLRRIAENRDKTAFERLYHRYAGRIRGLMLKAGASPGEADETAQEAMLAIWRKAHLFDPAKAGAATWIFTVARNRRIDLLRKARRPAPDPNDPLFVQEPVRPAEQDIAAAERDSLVRKAVLSLNDDQRAVVRMAFFEGLSHAEIAGRTGTPLGTIKSRLRLATGRLRGILGDHVGEELIDD